MAVRVEKNGSVWTIIHSRPEVRNAVDPASAAVLYEEFLKFERDDAANVAVFWGEGGAFCAGWDLKHAASLSGSNSLNPYDFPDTGEPPMAAMGPSRLELSKPVVAAVAGPAVAGGMELALWADIRVLETTAYMGVYCRRWGIPLIDGGTVRLPRLVGEGRALDLILTGRKVEADEALRIGLCEYVVPAGQSREKAEQLAQDISRFPQNCMRADRRSVKTQHELNLRDALRQEWRSGKSEVTRGVEGAKRFAGGIGRGGGFDNV